MEVNIREEAVYSLDIRDIEQTHFDTAHGDTAPHDDVAHDDWDEHADTAHGDAGHGDSTGAHTDSWDHNLVNHTDTYDDYALHSDHGDVPHSEWGDYNDWSDHSDSPHTDSPHEEHADSPHEDTAHTDTPHEDTTHGDYLHTDTAHTDHSDHTDWDDHSDWFHAEAVQGHTDFARHFDLSDPPAHIDYNDHSDWTDYGDHAEYHAWSDHNDYSAYNDASYIDHDDHTDTAHTDVPHNDAHDDAAHGDAPHNDTAHEDWSDHNDVAHDDWSNFNIRSTRPPFVTPFAGGLPGYRHRKKGAVNATTAGVQTNYQLKLIVGESSGSPGCDVHCENHCLDFPNDIRFTKEDGETKHDYWIEKIEGTTPNRKVTVWIEVASIPASGSVDFYMYYLKSGASSASNAANTFLLYVNWNDVTLGSTSQGDGTTEIQDGGRTLHMYGNSWKSAQLPSAFEIKNDGSQKIEINFKSSDLGEISAFEFSTDTTFTVNGHDSYDVGGSQAWADRVLDQDYTGAGAWQTIYTVLNDYAVSCAYILLAGDDDADSSTDQYWKDFRIRKYASPEPTWGTWGSEQ